MDCYHSEDERRVHLYRAKIKNPAPTMNPRYHWVEGGYVKHICRQVCVLGDDCVKPEDVVHLIVRSGFADWNMPRPLEAVEIDVDTLCQFTEMFDADDNPIFENAIVEFEDVDCRNAEKTTFVNRARVVFHNGRWELDNFQVEAGDYYEEMNMHSELMRLFKNCRVIGNYIDHRAQFEQMAKKEQ